MIGYTEMQRKRINTLYGIKPLVMLAYVSLETRSHGVTLCDLVVLRTENTPKITPKDNIDPSDIAMRIEDGDNVIRLQIQDGMPFNLGVSGMERLYAAIQSSDDFVRAKKALDILFYL